MPDGVGDRLLHTAKQRVASGGIKRIEAFAEGQMNLRTNEAPRQYPDGFFQIDFLLFPQLADHVPDLREQQFRQYTRLVDSLGGRTRGKARGQLQLNVERG